jgi:hypothetical protein
MASVSDRFVVACGKKDATVPVVVMVILVAAAWLLHLPPLFIGGISHYDEFYTLDRSISFARMGDWFTVFSANEPNFRKPPLQYWMTAGLLQAGVQETAALRLPSMLFALGTLGVTAWLARLLAPALPWAMPLSVALLASSMQFWSHANSAMLDVGAGFFAAATVAAAIAALERPKLWYLAAVLAGFGALQKAPVGLVFVAVGIGAVWLLRGRIAAPSLRRSPDFRRAGWLALALVLAWPLLQSIRYGLDAFSRSHDHEMIGRFAPDVDAGVRGLADLVDLLIVGEPWLRWPALLAVLIMPALVRRPGAVIVAAVIVAYVLALTMAGGNVYSRYTLTVLPLMMAALAVVLVRIRPYPLAGLTVGVMLAMLSGGPFRTGEIRDAALQPEVTASQVAVLRGVGAEIAPGETLVFCRSRGPGRLIPGAVSVYASNGQPILPLEELRKANRAPQGPLRGICTQEELAQVEPLVRNLRVVREEAGYVVWTAEGSR